MIRIAAKCDAFVYTRVDALLVKLFKDSKSHPIAAGTLASQGTRLGRLGAPGFWGKVSGIE